jgi:hypothetical protein
MFPHGSRWMHLPQAVMQRLTLGLVLGLAAAATMWSVAAVVGLAPWLGLEVVLGSPVDAGVAVQLILTAFLVGLCFFIPMNRRVMQLENSHREFRVSMWDVAAAYQAVHAADREGIFELKSEFDSVRDRLLYLRDHPDLGNLEPEILELAAQMSHESRELATLYSADRVERARQFLRQRQEEAEQMKARIQIAHASSRELKRWLQSVDMEEAVVRTQLARLKEELSDLLPVLELDEAEAPRGQAEIVSFHRLPAE